MYKSFAERAVLIGLMVLSMERNPHRYPQCECLYSLHTFNSQRSIVGPPGLAKMVFDMYESFAKRAVSIALTLLSIR
jgi:hypothetical protein